MWYPSRVTTEFFQIPSFIPVFAPSFLSETDRQIALSLCGNDENCLLDYATTGNVEIALATKAVNDDSTVLSNVLGKLL